MTKKNATRVLTKTAGSGAKMIYEVMSFRDFMKLGLKQGDIAYDSEYNRKFLIIALTEFEKQQFVRECTIGGIAYGIKNRKFTRDIVLVGYAPYYKDGTLDRCQTLIRSDIQIPKNSLTVCDEPFLGEKDLKDYRELEGRINAARRERARYDELCKTLDGALLKFNNERKVT